MSNGHRLLAGFAGGLALLIALATGAYFGALYAPHYGYQSAHSTYSGPASKQGNVSQIDRDRAGLPYFAERIASGTDPENRREREQRDLAAQESMSVWAFWMLAVSAAGVLTTMIGTGFLLWQIVLTRKAVKDTGDATRAMNRQNELMEAAQRPYIVVEPGPSPTEVDERGHIMPASYRYRNFGGTAAQIILQAHNVVVIEEPNVLPVPLKPGKRGRHVPSGEFVSPNDVTDFQSAGPIYNSHIRTVGSNVTVVPGPSPDWAKAFQPGRYTFFHGFVVYADFEGRCYIRGFCFQYEAGKFRLNHAQTTHNYDRRCNPDGTAYDDTHHHKGG